MKLLTAFLGLAALAGAVTLQSAPAAPTGFIGTANSTTQITWSWTPTANASWYLMHDPLETRVGPASGEIMAVTYQENNLAENTKYTRHLHAVAGGPPGGTQGPASTAYSRHTRVHDPVLADFSVDVITGTRVDVSVVPPPGAAVANSGCMIERSTDGIAWTVAKSYSSVYTYSDTRLAGGTTYYFRIRFRNGDGLEASPSPVRTVTTPPEAPVAPFGFAGSPLSPSSIRWSWEDVDGESTYALHDAAHVEKASLPADVVTYTETGLAENTSYSRHVHGVNAVGSGVPSSTITAWTKTHDPSASDFSLSVANGHQIDVSVVAPPNSGLGSTGCGIQRSADGVVWTTIKAMSNVYTFNDTGLEASKTYYYRVWYQNGGGTAVSAYSPVKNAATPAAPPLAPTGFVGTSPSTTSIEWSWTDVNQETSYALHDGAHAVKGTSAANVVFVNETGFSENTAYERHVHAVGAAGASDPSASLTRYTRVHDPVEADFSLTVVSGTQISVTVVPPPNSAAGSTGCQIEYASSPTGSATLIKSYSAVYAFNHTGLQGATTYYYRIRYRNGDGVQTSVSPWKNATTQGTPPAVPANFTWTAPSMTSVQFTWGGVSNESGYQVHDENHVLKGSTITDVTSFLETGLTENQPITRHVHAFNGAGSSNPSTAKTAYSRVHDATIADFSLSVVSGSQINVTVTPPPNGTLGTTGVYIQRSTDNATWTLAQNWSNVYAFSNTGLLGNTTYYYRIVFRNGGSVASLYSASRSATTPPTPPPTPSAVVGTALSTTSISWTWGNVANESGFELHDASHVVKASVGEGILTFLETGLTENTSYVRHAHAVNPSGSSAASTADTVYTLVRTPTIADFGLSVSGATVTVTVTPPVNPAVSYTGCEISRSIDGGTWVVAKGISSAYAYADSEALPNTTYQYRIRYRSAAGVYSIYSPTRVITTGAAVPLAPADLAGTELSTTAIRWKWDDVAAETSYELHDASHVVKGSTGEGELLFTETGLSENTNYTRHVHALNAAGSGAASTAVSRYTKVRNASLADFSLTVASANQINVSVTAPPNGTANSSGCEILRSVDGASWSVAKTFSNVYTLNNTGLVPSTTYYYKIRFRNGNGEEADYSPTRSASTPAGVPNAPGGMDATGLSTSIIRWTWDDVAVETGFELHDAAHAVIGSTAEGVTFFDEGGLPENTAQTRHVHALNASGSSAASAADTRYTLVHAPTVADFSLTVVSGTQINISVVPPPNSTAGTTGCEISRCSAGTGWSVVKSFSSAYTYNNTGLTSGTVYHYRIRYRNGNSVATAYSPALASGAPPAPTAAPAAPGGLAGTGQSTTTLLWSWTDVGEEDSYALHDAAHVEKGTSAQGLTAILESGLTENTLYARHVHAINTVGSSAASSEATRYTLVRDASLADFSLSATGTTVTITVVPPTNPTAGTTGCWIERSLDGLTWGSAKSFSNVYTYNDTDRTGSTKYYYRVTYRNGNSVSGGVSQVRSVTTSAATPADPPTFAGTGKSVDSILWTWGDTDQETGFELHDAAHALKGTAAENATQLLETGLSENTSYTRHLHALNASGSGAASAAVTEDTLVHEPLLSDFTLTVASAYGIYVNVVPPPNGTIGYSGCVIYRSTDGQTWTQEKAISNVYTLADSGLQPETTYYYRIQYRSAGNVYTSTSAYKTATTPAGAPYAPAGLAATMLSTSSLRWDWDDVGRETSYEIHDAAHVVKGTVGEGVLEFIETGLQENTYYYRHIHAVNATGSSGPSLEAYKATGVRDATLADFTLTVVSGNQVDISVTPLPNPTSYLTGVVIERSSDGAAWTSVSPASGVYVKSDTGVAGNTRYEYRIRYKNAQGAYSRWTPSKVVTTPLGTPTGLTATALSSSSMRWDWADVAGETGYQLHDATHGLRGNTAAGVITLTETGLPENSAVVRHVHAVDAAGSSGPGSTVTKYTLTRTPTPADFSVTAVDPYTVSVSVLPPSNPTSGGTFAQVQRSTDNATWTTIVAGNPVVYAWTGTDHGPGTQYYFRIRFRNHENVYSDYSASSSVTTPVGPPSAPATFSATVQSTSAIQWSWANVPGETGFEVRNENQTVKGSVAANILAYTETGLPENEPCVRHARSINAQGASAPSPVLTKYTKLHDPTLSDFTAQMLSSSSAQIVVVQPRNALLGLTACKIERSSNNGASYQTVANYPAPYTFTDINLTSNITYRYRITYRNGDGLATAVSSYKTVLIPGTPEPLITTTAKKTRKNTPLIQGNAVAGATVSIYFNDVLDGTASSVAGAWTYNATAKLEGAYTVKAKASLGGQDSGFSLPVAVQVDLTPPLPPSNLRTQPYATVIDVEWDPSPSPDVAGYHVYRRTAAGSWILQTTTGAVRETRFRDLNPSGTTTYFYRVSAVDNSVNE